MTLAALIQKNGLMRVATATPATSATEPSDEPRTVATVATVAVATPPTAHYRWRVILADGTPFEVCCSPELSQAEMQELYRGANLQPLPDAAQDACLSGIYEDEKLD